MVIGLLSGKCPDVGAVLSVDSVGHLRPVIGVESAANWCTFHGVDGREPMQTFELFDELDLAVVVY